MTSRTKPIPQVLVHDPYLKKNIKIPMCEITKAMELVFDIRTKVNYWQYNECFPFIDLIPPINLETIESVKKIQLLLQEVEPKSYLQWIQDLIPDFADIDEIRHWLKIADAYHEVCCREIFSIRQKKTIYRLLLTFSWTKTFCKKDFKKYLSKRTIKFIRRVYMKQK